MTTPSFRAFRAADAPWLIDAHASLYASEEGFDETFGEVVASILADFVETHDPEYERGWIAEIEGAPVGSIFCVRAGIYTAKLRLFLVLPTARGSGIGWQLLQRCLAFARAADYGHMTLWTHESHRAACALYKKAGFSCIESSPVRNFGVDLVEQTWDIAL